jgi:hypothetical protein
MKPNKREQKWLRMTEAEVARLSERYTDEQLKKMLGRPGPIEPPRRAEDRRAAWDALPPIERFKWRLYWGERNPFLYTTKQLREFKRAAAQPQKVEVSCEWIAGGCRLYRLPYGQA